MLKKQKWREKGFRSPPYGKAIPLLILTVMASFSFIGILASLYLKSEPPNLYEINGKNKGSVGEPVSAGPPISYNGTGDPINITYGMTYYSQGIPMNNNYSSGNNILKALAPSDPNFNSSEVNITVGNIDAPNVTFIIQDAVSPQTDVLDVAIKDAASFKADYSCYLAYASFYLSNSSDNVGVNIHLYNATWNAAESQTEPDTDLGVIGTFAVTARQWYDVLVNYYLDNTKTANNTWFFALTVNGTGLVVNWYLDGDVSGVDGNNSDVYTWNGLTTSWSLKTVNGETIDYAMKVTFAASTDSVISPSEVKMKINGTDVTDINNGNITGTWISYDRYSAPSGELLFNFTADYWNVSWTVFNFTVKYSEEDITSVPSFGVKSGDYVIWNTTITADKYGTDFIDYVLNYTIPDGWSPDIVYNITTKDNRTYSVWDRPDGFKVLSVNSPGNGTWTLLCNSTNLASDIKTYVNSIEIYTYNYSSDVVPKTLFGVNIAGTVNLTIYSPSGDVNYTQTNTTPGAQELYFPVFDVSASVTEYGIFKIQMSWNNGTDAAFMEKEVTVLADTEGKVVTPAPNSIYNPNDVFNITVYFNDTGKNLPIDGATISYAVDGGTWSSVNYNNGTSGYYTFMINCSNYASGDHTVTIMLNKTYYNNVTLNYPFHINTPPVILNKTDLQSSNIWNVSEDDPPFDVNLTSYESDAEDSGTLLDWYVTDLNTTLVNVTGEYSDNDILTFTPRPNMFGTDTFTLHLVDSMGLEDTVQITITVNPVNDPPVILNKTEIQNWAVWTQNEDFGQFSVNFSGYASDIDNYVSQLQWSITDVNTSLITVTTDNSTLGLFTFNSVNNAYGSDDIIIHLTDPDGAEDTLTVTITVNPVNDAPVINNKTDIQNMGIWDQNEDFGSFTVNLSAYGTDIDNYADQLTWFITDLNTSLVTVDGNNTSGGTFTFHSVANIYGSDTFTVHLADPDGLEDTVDITINVYPVNDAPVILNVSDITGMDIWTTQEDFGSFTVNFSDYASDVDNAKSDLVWSISGVNTSLVSVQTINAAEGIFKFLSVSNAFGMDTFTLTLTDPNGASDSVDITINILPVNDPPTITNKTLIASWNIWKQKEDFGSFTLNFTNYAEDIDNPVSTLVWYVTAIDTSIITVSGNNSDVLTFISVANASGIFTFRLYVADPSGGTDYVTITMNVTAVNDPPVIINTDKLLNLPVWTQDINFEPFSINLTEYGLDAEDSPSELRWYVSDYDPTKFYVTGNMSDNNVLTFHSVFGVSGTFTFRLHVVDTDGAESVIIITLTIKEKLGGDTPVLEPSDAYVIIGMAVGAAAVIQVTYTVYKRRKKGGRVPPEEQPVTA